MHIEATNINHALRDQIVAVYRYCHEAGHPLAGFVIIDDVAMANELIKYCRFGIFRSYPAGEKFSMSKIGSLEAAFNHANEIWAAYQGAIVGLDKHIYVQTRNEKGINEFDWAYEVQIMKLAESQGRLVGLFGDSVGTPDPAQWFWRLAALRYAMAHGHCVVRHDYGPWINGKPSNLPVSTLEGLQYFGGRTIWLYSGSPADCRPLFLNGETGNSSAIVIPNAADDWRRYNELTNYPWYGAFMLWGFGNTAQIYDHNGLLAEVQRLALAS